MELRLVTPEQLSTVLSARRRARGFTQGALAKPIQISQNRYSELEQDPAKMTLDRLLAIAHALGLEVVIREADQSPTSPRTPTSW